MITSWHVAMYVGLFIYGFTALILAWTYATMCREGYERFTWWALVDFVLWPLYVLIDLLYCCYYTLRKWRK